MAQVANRIQPTGFRTTRKKYVINPEMSASFHTILLLPYNTPRTNAAALFFCCQSRFWSCLFYLRTSVLRSDICYWLTVIFRPCNTGDGHRSMIFLHLQVKRTSWRLLKVFIFRESFCMVALLASDQELNFLFCRNCWAYGTFLMTITWQKYGRNINNDENFPINLGSW